ncbi:hypothetical protein WIS52_12355 [Pseudonocardia nematodicida]|uniref:Roadblock/LAMTOR2 domain-containing protein n=1 Tax=Pseudonocardia nematodicida TaxID=1206997 RepID=A0ABV1K9W3_9PSEU
MESWSEALRDVMDVPGARYACITDLAGAVLAARGDGGGSGGGEVPAPDPAGTAAAAAPPPDQATTLLGWGRGQAALEDVVVTTGQAYHLVRTLPRGGDALLAYLRVDRSRGNLALARRALQALPGNPSPPAQMLAPPVPDTARRGPAGATRSRPVHPQPSRTGIPAPPIPIPVQSRAPVVERHPPLPVPLPRRGHDHPGDDGADAPGPAVGGPPVAPPGPPGGRWADDLSTLARVLAGLRRL